jgi:hypothetical protein
VLVLTTVCCTVNLSDNMYTRWIAGHAPIFKFFPFRRQNTRKLKAWIDHLQWQKFQLSHYPFCKASKLSATGLLISTYKHDGQCTYCKRSSEARSCNHFCSGKTRSITYSECVCVSKACSPSMQNPCAAVYFHLWPVWLYHIFPYYLKNGMIFENTLGRTLNTCFDYLYNFCLKHFSFHEEFSEILS